MIKVVAIGLIGCVAAALMAKRIEVAPIQKECLESRVIEHRIPGPADNVDKIMRVQMSRFSFEYETICVKRAP